MSHNGLSIFGEAHRHCHFNPYNLNEYSVGNYSAPNNTKNGFCIIAVPRLSNNEYSPYKQLLSFTRNVSWLG